MKTLCAVGEALIDFIPERKGERLKDVMAFRRVAGGAPANAAAAVAKLGGSARFVTQLGKDAFGDHIVETLQSIGMDTRYIFRTSDADTSLAFVSLTADGNRDFIFYRRTCADQQLQPACVDKHVLDDCGILHFCSVSLVPSPMKETHKKLVELAQENHVLISFDPNVRLNLWKDESACRNTIRDFLPCADILKISDEELEFISGYSSIEDALDFFFQGNCKYLIYTMGKNGARLYFKDKTYISADGFCVDVKDTTGAGDSFIGAFLYQLLDNEIQNLEDADTAQLTNYLEFANLYAAHTTTKEGAIDAMATMQEIKSFQAYLK